MMFRPLRQVPARDWALALLFYVLNAADAAITLHAYHHVPGMYEVNPIMRWGLYQGDGMFILLKMGMAAFLTYFSLRLNLPAKYNTVLLIGSGMLGLVVLWNIVLYVLSTYL